MKNECDIVQDLLFSYKDGCLKQGSKEFVEKHLTKCEECAKIYKEMNNEEDNGNTEKTEIDYLKKIKKKMKRKTKIIIFVLILLIFLIIFNITVFISYNDYAGRVEIFLEDNISEEDVNNIENIIKEVDQNAEIEYKSKEKALNDLKERFKENENLLAGYGASNNIMPASYIVKTDKKYVTEIESRFINNNCVKKITVNTETNPYVYFFWYKIYLPITGK